MRIAVVGAGGVGGAYGAALAKAGADVTFIARGAHLAAMKSKGLKLESQRGDITSCRRRRPTILNSNPSQNLGVPHTCVDFESPELQTRDTS
jgi:ketopantoate reductase